MSRRIERINDLIRELVAEIVARELKDPRLGVALLSITEVDTSPDLRNARIQVSVLGSSEERDEALRALNHSHGFIRRLLKQQLHTRSVPRLHFEPDERIARDQQAYALLDRITPPAPAADGEPG